VFLDSNDVTPEEYIAMLFILNEESHFNGSAKVKTLSRALRIIESDSFNEVLFLNTMCDRGLISFRRSNRPLFEYVADADVVLTREGFAFLINYAQQFIEKIKISMVRFLTTDCRTSFVFSTCAKCPRPTAMSRRPTIFPILNGWKRV